jgi:LacI family transcriptional regulator
MGWLTERIAALPSPSAVVGVSDETAVYVLEACRAAGRPVPEQLAVVGFDNDELACDHAVVPLSTVDTNLEEMAYRAAALLEELMAGRPIPDAPILIPPKGFVTRQSSDLIAVDHTEVARALRMITDRFRDPNLTIAHIVAETAISRRNLDRAFLSRLGRTITGELMRVRLTEARRLLEETKLNVQQVAEASGFSGDKQLRQTLHRELGMTPKQYRRRATSA